MNTVLLVTTGVAVTFAVVAAIAVFVIARSERRRADARVAALRSLSGLDAIEPQGDAGAMDLDELRSAPDGTETRGLFASEARPSSWRGRLAAAAGTFAIIAALGYVLVARDNSPAAEHAVAKTADESAPLELLSLRHQQETDRMVVTGLVQNPRGAAARSKVVATVFLFGADGTFLASGRAPLDFSTLTAGDESPFVVTVPVATAVARYRVGFRGEDGRVIAHVDRRTTGTLARTRE